MPLAQPPAPHTHMSIADAPGWVKAFATGATVGVVAYVAYTLALKA